MDMHATPLPTLFLSSFPLQLLFTFQVSFQKLLPSGSLPDVSSCPSGQMCLLCTSGASFLSPTLCPWLEVLGITCLPPDQWLPEGRPWVCLTQYGIHLFLQALGTSVLNTLLLDQ